MQRGNIFINEGISYNFWSTPSIGIPVSMTLFFSVYVLKKLKIPSFAIALLVGASVSNIVDRIVFGGVRDIWYVPVLGIYNNLADWIIVGVICFCLYYIVLRKNT